MQRHGARRRAVIAGSMQSIAARGGQLPMAQPIALFQLGFRFFFKFDFWSSTGIGRENEKENNTPAGETRHVKFGTCWGISPLEHE